MTWIVFSSRSIRFIHCKRLEAFNFIGKVVTEVDAMIASDSVIVEMAITHQQFDDIRADQVIVVDFESPGNRQPAFMKQGFVLDG